MNKKEKELFENASVLKAVFRLAFPTVLGQIILVIYNMADIFFVGLAGNDAMMTAVTVCMPAFMFLSAISNLFGVGGASVISRALGKKEEDRAKAASAFAFWGCLIAALLYSGLAFVGRDLFADLLGGSDAAVHQNAVEYLTVTVVIGGVSTSMAGLFSHLIRSEGRSVHASAGIMLGGLLNIALDPLFMFALLPSGKEALGAAVATALSNGVSLAYFIAVQLMIRKKSLLSYRYSTRIWYNHVPEAVLEAGLPACVMTLFENISSAVLDKLLSLSGLAMQAGVGVAKKINMLAHCIVRGIAQGALPLIGYSCAAGNWERMRKAVKTAHFAAVSTACVCAFVSLAFARQLTGIFIHHDSPSLFLRRNVPAHPVRGRAVLGQRIYLYFLFPGHGRRKEILFPGSPAKRAGGYPADVPLEPRLAGLWDRAGNAPGRRPLLRRGERDVPERYRRKNRKRPAIIDV